MKALGVAGAAASAGKKFYGPGRSYYNLVGRDATRAFGTGCTKLECCIPSVVGLTAAELREIDRWVEFYEHHDKYTLVGKLRDGLEVHARRRLPAAAPHQGLNGRHVRAQELDAEGREALDAWRQVQLDEAMYAEGTSRRRLFRPK